TQEERAMKVAITGGTGFVGRHFAELIAGEGHEVVLIARGQDKRDRSVERMQHARIAHVDVADVDALADAFACCDAVAHCAGINREIGDQTYQKVHIDGTRCVVDAARRAGVARVALISFLRARPNAASPYHTSKFAAEEIVRNSGIEYTILKPGVIYGKGDHMLDHLSHVFYTVPLFGLVGFEDKECAPVAVQDVARILKGALIDGLLQNRTVAVLGPERMPLSHAVKKVAEAVGKKPLFFPMPIPLLRIMAWGLERTMTVPLISFAQLTILSEGVVEPEPACDPPPEALKATTRFTIESIRAGLPDAGPFGVDDLLCCKG
ncbi:MAG: NAD(P)H-binding protein, partial [Terriglobales bacterium]